MGLSDYGKYAFGGSQDCLRALSCTDAKFYQKAGQGVVPDCHVPDWAIDATCPRYRQHPLPAKRRLQSTIFWFCSPRPATPKRMRSPRFR